MSPLPSKRQELWRRLYDRYALEPGQVDPADRPAVFLQVVPVLQADELLRKLATHQDSISITGVGTVDLLTVPSTERWRLHWVYFVKGPGAFTYDTLAVTPEAGNLVVVDTFTATSGTRLWPNANAPIPLPFPLDRGWKLQLNVNSFTTAGSITVRTVHEVEESY